MAAALLVALACSSSSSNQGQGASQASDRPWRLAYITVEAADDDSSITSRLYVVTLGGAPTLIREYPGEQYYEILASPDGQKIAVTSGAIVILDSAGEQLMTLDDPAISFSGAGPFASWSPDSATFAYTRADRVPNSNTLRIETVDVASRSITTSAKLRSAPLRMPSFSPDGKHFAGVSTNDPQDDHKMTIAIADVSGDFRTLSGQPSSDVLAMPLWSPDGSHIAYWLPNGSVAAGGRETPPGVFITSADGGEPVFIPHASLLSPQSWTPDGARLAMICEVENSEGARRPDVCVVDSSGAKPRIVTDDGDVISAAFSPDGTSIAYLATRDSQGTFTLKVLRVATGETATIASGVIIGGFSFLAGSG